MGISTTPAGSITWSSGVTQTLPPSFYLSSKPSWWGSIPFPATGPDVTGGNGPGGHSYGNPAGLMLFKTMGGSDGGAGGPLTFNAAHVLWNGPSGTSRPQPALPQVTLPVRRALHRTSDISRCSIELPLSVTSHEAQFRAVVKYSYIFCRGDCMGANHDPDPTFAMRVRRVAIR